MTDAGYLGRWALAGFLGAAAAPLIASGWLVGDVPDGFTPGQRAQPVAGGVFRLTLDARSSEHWRGVNFATGHASPPYDLLVRRHVVRAPGGAVDLGPSDVASAVLPKTVDWILDQEEDGVLQNPAIGRWFTYSYWTHLLRSKGHVYAVRRPEGPSALVTMRSYYCAPEGSGCLTLDFRLVEAP